MPQNSAYAIYYRGTLTSEKAPRDPQASLQILESSHNDTGDCWSCKELRV